MYPGKDPNFGVYIKEQVESLKKKGIDFKLIVRRKKSGFSYIKLYLKIFFSILSSKYDIVHGHYGFHSSLIAAILKTKPIIITYHGSDALIEPKRNRLYNFLQKYVVKKTDHNIAVSMEIQNSLITELGASYKKISIIPCGVDTTKFLPMDKKQVRKSLGLNNKNKIILFIGRLNLSKGEDILFRVAKIMKEAIFIIIGSTKTNSFPNNCIYLGEISNLKLPKIIPAADVLFLPSRSEGSPLVIKEALSCAVPVVCSDVGDCRKIVKTGKSGYVVKLDESGNTFVSNIREIINDPDKTTKMGLYGRNDMIKKMDINIITDEIIEIYYKFAITK
jgi:glycosyltransferase involved in cell wall biosynthesis